MNVLLAIQQTGLSIDSIHTIRQSRKEQASVAAAFQLSGSNIFLGVKEQSHSHLVFNVFYDGQCRRRAVLSGDRFCETQMLSTERL